MYPAEKSLGTCKFTTTYLNTLSVTNFFLHQLSKDPNLQTQADTTQTSQPTSVITHSSRPRLIHLKPSEDYTETKTRQLVFHKAVNVFF